MSITDASVIRKTHQFLRDEEADAASGDWERRAAWKYYKSLNKEFAIFDTSRYREGKIALRWRTRKEAIDGRGKYTCGNRHCEEGGGELRSYEVNFAYQEGGEVKNELVKVKACAPCARKLFYKKIKALQREARQRKRKAKAAKEGQIEEELLQYNDFCQKKGHDEVQYVIERYDDDIKTIRNSSSRRDSEECCYGGFREGLDHPIRNSKRGKKSLKKGKCTDA